MKAVFNLSREIRDQCFHADALRELHRLVEVDSDTPDKISKEWLIPQLKDAEIIITGWGSLPLTNELLSHASELKLVLHSAGSIKGVESEEMWERGIRITSAANVNGEPVAEFLLGQILMCLKNVFRYSQNFRTHGRQAWVRDHGVRGYYRSTVGIIGMGNVGKHLLKLLGAFQMNVLVHSFYPFEEQARVAGVELTGIDEIFQQSDIVVLAAPNISEYLHMVDARRLALMKDGSWFLNSARGALVEEAALLGELQSGRLNACLDVTDQEPPVDGSPFYSLPNCILTPHVAGSIGPECQRLGDQVVKELKRYIAGEPFENEITQELSALIG